MMRLRQIEWTWPLRMSIVVLAVLSLAFGAAGAYGMVATISGQAASAGDGATAVIPANPKQPVTLANPAAAQNSPPVAAAPQIPGAPSVPTATISYLRFVNAAGNLPAIQVLIDQVPAYSSLSFAHATDYIQVTSGAHTVVMQKAGDAKTVYATVNVSLTSQQYSLAIYGLDGAAFPVDRIQATLYLDLPNVSGNDMALRVVNLGVARPPLDVLLKRGSLPRKREYWDIAYTHATGQLNLAPGSYSFTVGNNPTYIVQKAFYVSPSYSLRAQTPYSAWLIGGSGLKVSGAAFRVFITEDVVSTHGDG